ncbi:MAG: YnfA family protein [Bacteroidetes bacterium]|nr:MAG: YnfA family protein [Bacteroidota bacterium]
MSVLQSLPLLILAGLCEIGGGYLVWIWLREGKPIGYGIAGALILALYGVVATFQPTHFARAYAAYGGVFILMSLLWSYVFDHYVPDAYDIAGALLILLGVCVMYYAPR